ncbi:MAG TPA: acetyl-CoA C-acyltransferase [Gemmatimonadales bacterium]|nr:acetyl-CoA C-acyltransferase [Gemmatimonadales bacterium]
MKNVIAAAEFGVAGCARIPLGCGVVVGFCVFAGFGSGGGAMAFPNGRRVAVVAGCRTPFCKSGTALKDVRAVDLARYAARELMERTNLDPAKVDEVIFGQVVASPLVPNIAREVSLLPQFPKEIPAFSVNRACASSNQAVTAAHDQIAQGHADVILAGGAESLSDIPILASRRLADILVAASKARTLGARLGAFTRIRPRDLIPVAPAIAEPSTGESMGQSAEKMAKENRITRDAQDRWTLRSHQLAAQGTADGRLTAEIAPWLPQRAGGEVVQADNGIRTDTTLEQMAKLRPVFDRRYGTVTAANSSPLTDGASAVLLMAEDVARALGYEPLAFIRSYAVAAVDPGWQLLQAPVWAVPKALERAGIQWKDLGLIEIHEAFASQVLSNLQGFAAKGWEIDEDIINVMGGSIAIGHPFGATGGRLVTTLANEMKRRDVQFGLISVCAQGGMASAVVLERR